VYSDEFFGGRVERIPVRNHAPPTMHQLVCFVEHAARHLERDPDACIAVHCASGTGRTGVMVAAWLLYSTFSPTADDAMRWFAARRVGKRAGPEHGVPMVSQRRYVAYMQEAAERGGYHTKRLFLVGVAVRRCPMMDAQGGCSLWLTVEEDGVEVHRSAGAGPGGARPLQPGLPSRRRSATPTTLSRCCAPSARPPTARRPRHRRRSIGP
jgi:hypothetical protein